MHQRLTTQRAIHGFLLLLFIVAVAHALYMLAIGFRNVTFDGYPFRQAQTALTAYWLARGGPWFAYETPVLGAPWAIPFEFPAYQWLVALLSRMGLSIQEAGRAISFAFFLATLLPIHMLTKTYNTGRASFLIVSILFLSSPLYVFWSRSIMIETAATFFAAAWLALLARILFRPRYRTIAAALAAGCAATLTKSTTFPPFACLGALLVLHRLYLSAVTDTPFSPRRLIAVLMAGLVPFLVGSWWVSYSEHVKSMNEIAGTHLSFQALQSWNFGTYAQRISATLWRDVVTNRVLPDLLGYGVVPALVALGASLVSRRALIIVAGLILAFLVPFFLTTNLHIVHSYYQISNGIFLIAAIGTGLTCLLRQGRTVTAVLLLTCIVCGQIGYFRDTYESRFSTDHTDVPYYQIALAAKDVTSKRQSVIAFGTDWSSEVPFYAQRKGFAVPSWSSVEEINHLLAKPADYLDGYPLGAIIDCFGDSKSSQAAVVRTALKDKPLLATRDGCRLFGP